ncbi:pyridoxamine 5'-phosphate oxidase family protein [Myroides ceti]|uniref:Pyridoxamine 5'-phosphate oxidase family protein n=1 Tax=Paenimyroides ceti TaxID=395087 RepID=A0ABT8CQ54_9FLAO|nr:pyridoxamine 5'-phosphate oxidase family protein [Paenimyroides ceti]MDN3706633.1 pyridoxamine 5'-phosphate oxidase family protein [Paenimyroides ceti]
MSTENLQHKEAVEKFKQMIDSIDIGMLSTFPKDQEYPHSIPMSRQEVDDEGNIWFLFSSESETHQHLLKNDKVTLTFAHVGDYQFLSVNATAEISKDQARIDKYWNKFIEAWFEKGKEDPRIRVLKVIPNEAYYWDNKTNKLMTLLKVATSAVTGKKMDIGREGELDL